MAKRKCTKDGCFAPEDLCSEFGNSEYPKCPHFPKEGIAKVTKTIKKSATTTIPWTGEWLWPEQLDLLAHRGVPKVIGLVGASGAGKTTYLAMLYSLLFNGKHIENWDFSGSYTLNAWELQAKTLQVQDDGTVQNPDTTPSEKDFYSLYHLALRNDGFLHDILFADSSGEVFSKWADNVNDPAAENARWIYENAQAFILFVDCEAIIEQLGSANLDMVQLAGQLKKGLGNRPVVVAWSKADLYNKMPNKIAEAINANLSETFPGAVTFKISNYSKSESDQLCHINNIGVAKVLLDQLINPQPLHIVPTPTLTNDYFFLYRGSYGNK